MSNLKRYRIGISVDDPTQLYVGESPNGVWVKFEDIKELLKRAHNNARQVTEAFTQICPSCGCELSEWESRQANCSYCGEKL